MQFSGWLAAGIDPAAHGVPWARAHYFTTTDFAFIDPDDEDIGYFTCCCLDGVLRGGGARAFGIPAGHSGFRWIDPSEWSFKLPDGTNIPEIEGDQITLNGKTFRDVHVVAPEGLPPIRASYAFMPEYMRQRRIIDGRINNASDKDVDVELLSCLQDEILSGSLILSGIPRPRRGAEGPVAMSPVEARQDVSVEQLRSAFLKWSKSALEGFEERSDPTPLWRFGNVLIRQPLPKMRDEVVVTLPVNTIPKGKGGRPVKYDWAMIERYVGRWIVENGDEFELGALTAYIDWVLNNISNEMERPGDAIMKARVREIFDYHQDRDEKWQTEKANNRNSGFAGRHNGRP